MTKSCSEKAVEALVIIIAFVHFSWEGILIPSKCLKHPSMYDHSEEVYWIFHGLLKVIINIMLGVAVLQRRALWVQLWLVVTAFFAAWNFISEIKFDEKIVVLQICIFSVYIVLPWLLVFSYYRSISSKVVLAPNNPTIVQYNPAITQNNPAITSATPVLQSASSSLQGPPTEQTSSVCIYPNLIN